MVQLKTNLGSLASLVLVRLSKNGASIMPKLTEPALLIHAINWIRLDAIKAVALFVFVFSGMWLSHFIISLMLQYGSCFKLYRVTEWQSDDTM